jgi:hypothetical protein
VEAFYEQESLCVVAAACADNINEFLINGAQHFILLVCRKRTARRAERRFVIEAVAELFVRRLENHPPVEVSVPLGELRPHRGIDFHC